MANILKGKGVEMLARGLFASLLSVVLKLMSSTGDRTIQNAEDWLKGFFKERMAFLPD